MTSSMIVGLNPPKNPSFAVASIYELICPVIATPLPIQNLIQIGNMYGFEIDTATNSIKNTSNKVLQVTGNASIQCIQTGSQSAILVIASERSIDGINWVANEYSLRENSVEKSGVGLLTIPSFAVNGWQPNEYIRFIFAKTGSGGITIEAGSKIVNGYDIDRFSFYWSMEAR
jgi:hypothetical protein